MVGLLYLVHMMHMSYCRFVNHQCERSITVGIFRAFAVGLAAAAALGGGTATAVALAAPATAVHAHLAGGPVTPACGTYFHSKCGEGISA
jgi:outer membrane lipoprotein SlyB